MDSNKKFWDRTAKLYTPMQERTNKELYAAVAKRCEKYIRADMKVLELGCGTGQFTFLLADRAASWDATDYSGRMAAEGEKRNHTKARFSVQDATALTYEAASFDAVMIANCLHIMPEPEKALREISRVLRPDGIFIAPTFVYEGKINRFRLGIMKLAGFKSYYEWNSDEYAAVLEKAGYEVIERDIIRTELLPEGFFVLRKKK